jgi:hypothetical protein
LLVPDNVSRHPYNLTDHFPKVNVVIIPPNTTSLVQPMDKGMTANIKAYCLRKISAHALEVIG